MLTVGGGVVGGFVGLTLGGAVGRRVGLTLGDFDGLEVGFDERER